MRASIGTRHVRVGGHVPGPSSIFAAGGGILALPLLVLTGVIYVVGAVLIVAVKLLGWLLKVVWALLKVAFFAVAGVFLVVTAPIWAPARGLRHRHHRKVLAGHQAWAKAQARQALASPPAGDRVG